MSLAKLELNDIGTLANPASARQALNDNFKKIEDEFEKVVYRDGSVPNSMEADLDMDSHRILNVADAVHDKDAVNKGQVADIAYEAAQVAIEDELSHFLKLPPGVTNMSLPPPDPLAVIGWNEAGNGLRTVTLPDAGSGTYEPGWEGALESRLIADKLRETISVLDFGADPTGNSDSTAAIKAAMAAAAGKSRLYFPAGTYIVSEYLLVPSHSYWYGDGMDRTIIKMAGGVGRETPVITTGKLGEHHEFILIEDLQVDFNSARWGITGGATPGGSDNTRSCVVVCNSSYVWLRRVKAINAYKHCFDVTAPSYGRGMGSSVYYDPEPSLFVWLEGCYASGAGDDNITTHQSSYIWIKDCVSEDTLGHYTENSNAYEIDDGSRNVFLSNCMARRAVCGLQIKGHNDAPAPYNVVVDGFKAYNCYQGVEAHHTGWYGESGVGNFVPSAYSAVNDNILPSLSYATGSTVTSATIEDNPSANFGHEYKFVVGTTTDEASSRVYFVGGGGDQYNIPLQAGQYIISFWARADANGHVVKPQIRIPPGLPGSVFISPIGGGQIALTTTRTRYWAFIDVPDLEAVGGKCNLLLVTASQPGPSSGTVYIDGLMIEPARPGQTAPSTFTSGPAVPPEDGSSIGASETARNIILNNIEIIAPREKTSGGTTFQASYPVRIRSYRGVQVNNLVITDGAEDLAKSIDGYQPATAIAAPSLIRVYAGAEDVQFSNVTLRGFSNLVQYGFYLSGSVGPGVGVRGLRIIDGPPHGFRYASGTYPVALDDYRIQANHAATAGSTGVRMASIPGMHLGAGTVEGYELPIRFGGLDFNADIACERKMIFARDGIHVYTADNPLLVASSGSERMIHYRRGSTNVGSDLCTSAGRWLMVDTDSSLNRVIFGGYNNDDTNTRTAWAQVGAASLLPGSDNVSSLGDGSTRWTQVYAANGTINTSDAREKTPVEPLTDAELAAAADIAREIGTFRWLSAVEEKGDTARRHVGLTVQRAIEIMREHGLDPFAYGFICYDKWEADETRDAGDRYSFRTDQLALFIARGQEERLRRLEAKG